MKRYQVTEYADFFNQKELFDIIKNLKPEEKIEIIKLEDVSVLSDEGVENGS